MRSTARRNNSFTASGPPRCTRFSPISMMRRSASSSSSAPVRPSGLKLRVLISVAAAISWRIVERSRTISA